MGLSNQTSFIPRRNCSRVSAKIILRLLWNGLSSGCSGTTGTTARLSFCLPRQGHSSFQRQSWWRVWKSTRCKELRANYFVRSLRQVAKLNANLGNHWIQLRVSMSLWHCSAAALRCVQIAEQQMFPSCCTACRRPADGLQRAWRCQRNIRRSAPATECQAGQGCLVYEPAAGAGGTVVNTGEGSISGRSIAKPSCSYHNKSMERLLGRSSSAG